MGCILFELAVGSKAFQVDWDTYIYHHSPVKSLEIPLDGSFGEQCKERITKSIKSILQIEASERPSAAYLAHEFVENVNLTALQAEPQNYWLWDRLCRQYVRDNNLNGAIEACEHELSKNPTNPSPLMELSNLYAIKGDYTAACATSKKIMKIEPHLLQVAFNNIASPTYKPNEYEVQRRASLRY